MIKNNSPTPGSDAATPHIISLGAGVQSTAMSLMAACGELKPMPTAAIFADTGAEPAEVYDHLDWLEDELPFPVYRVQHKAGLTKNLEAVVADGVRCAQPPMYTKNPDGSDGQLLRICTVEFKVNPIRRKVREILGLKPRQRTTGQKAIQWIGISLDEIQRMKESTVPYIENIFPLVDKRMRRGDCIEWMQRNDYPIPPRSACTYCPYHSNSEWRRIKQDPNEWAEAIRIDKLLRNGWPGVDSKLYLHSDRMKLGEIDLSTDIDRGQMTFLDECAGMCGV